MTLVCATYPVPGHPQLAVHVTPWTDDPGPAAALAAANGATWIHVDPNPDQDPAA